MIEPDAISYWFGLSYASFMVMPRVLMEQMSGRWQRDMVALLQEFEEAFPGAPGEYQVRRSENGRLIKTPEVLRNYRHPRRDEIDKMRREPK